MQRLNVKKSWISNTISRYRHNGNIGEEGWRRKTCNNTRNVLEEMKKTNYGSWAEYIKKTKATLIETWTQLRLKPLRFQKVQNPTDSQETRNCFACSKVENWRNLVFCNAETILFSAVCESTKCLWLLARTRWFEKLDLRMADRQLCWERQLSIRWTNLLRLEVFFKVRLPIKKKNTKKCRSSQVKA